MHFSRATTAIGIGFGLLCLGLGASLEGTSVLAFFNIPAALIVLGGTFGATMAGTSLARMRSIPRLYMRAVRAETPDLQAQLEMLTSLAERARREGLLALDDDVVSMSDPFARKGLQLVVDGTDPEVVREILNNDVDGAVDDVVPDMISLGETQRVLQALLHEGVSVRDLGAILEVIGDKARLTRDPNLLAEYARQTLGRAITAPYLDSEKRLRAISLDPSTEQEVSDAITQTSDGEYLVMEPSRAQALVSALRVQVDRGVAYEGRPVLLCSARVRRHLRRLCEQTLPDLAICSYNEIVPGIRVETVGVVNA